MNTEVPQLCLDEIYASLSITALMPRRSDCSHCKRRVAGLICDYSSIKDVL